MKEDERGKRKNVSLQAINMNTLVSQCLPWAGVLHLLRECNEQDLQSVGRWQPASAAEGVSGCFVRQGQRPGDLGGYHEARRMDPQGSTFATMVQVTVLGELGRVLMGFVFSSSFPIEQKQE